MNKYAVVKLGSKQFNIKEGDIFSLERQKTLNAEVLMYCEGDTIKIGSPTLDDVSVELSVVKETNAPKIRVARFKSKSRYRKVNGHKQPITIVKVESLGYSKKDKSNKSEVIKDVKVQKEEKNSNEVKDKVKKTKEVKTKLETKSKATIKKDSSKGQKKDVKTSTSKTVNKSTKKEVKK